MFHDGPQSAQHRCAKWNARYAGTEAFSAVAHGYRHGTINYQKVLAHRVIWKLVTGDDPVEIDHIDGSASNNSWANLRSVSRGENCRNLAMNKRNTSGHNGVLLVGGKWVAQGCVRANSKYLGSFSNIETAIAARKRWEVENGFHANHGRQNASSQKGK